jgi:hypothetical protein
MSSPKGSFSLFHWYAENRKAAALNYQVEKGHLRPSYDGRPLDFGAVDRVKSFYVI